MGWHFKVELLTVLLLLFLSGQIQLLANGRIVSIYHVCSGSVVWVVKLFLELLREKMTMVLNLTVIGESEFRVGFSSAVTGIISSCSRACRYMQKYEILG